MNSDANFKLIHVSTFSFKKGGTPPFPPNKIAYQAIEQEWIWNRGFSALELEKKILLEFY